MHFSSERFSSLYYNPILTNLNTSLTQSDIHFNARQTPCDYFIENQFNKMLKCEKYSDVDFSLLHLNIRSLQHNNTLTNLLSSLEINFSIINTCTCISETWLSDSFPSVDIDGFRFVHKYKQNRPGGGVGLYVSNDIEGFCFSDVNITESLFIKVLRPGVKNIIVIVGIVYRPPNQSVDEFLTKINESLGKISRKNKRCFLLGNFNII